MTRRREGGREGAAPLPSGVTRHQILTLYDTGKGADPDPLFGGREPESKPDPLPPGGSHRGRVSESGLLARSSGLTASGSYLADDYIQATGPTALAAG